MEAENMKKIIKGHLLSLISLIKCSITAGCTAV